jgi:TolB-like protein/DNA-binding winged helix-turn-helix (wHTH) protein
MDFRVGPWLVRPALNRVVNGSHSSRITPKSMEVLVCLAKRSGEVASKDALFQEAWPGTHVTDDALTKCIGELRRVFQSSKGEPAIIETIAKRGYRVAVPVMWEAAETSSTEASETATAGDAAAAGWMRSPRLALGTTLLAIVTIVVVAGFGKLRGFLGTGTSHSAIQSIAVLPLTDLSGNPEQEYFAEGMTEELITELAQIEAWKVISRTSVMRYKGSKKSLPEIARDLGVAGIVEGTVSRKGDRVRVTARLIDAHTDLQLWSSSFESEFRDVLGLQKNIARAIAKELSVKTASDARLPANRQRSMVPEAYEDYLKGRYFLDRRQYTKAASHFERAATKDPKFALAHALLAEADGMQTFSIDLPASPRAVRAMETALALDDTLAEAHMVAGDTNFFWKWDWQEGEAEYRRAVELDGNSVDAAAHYAVCLHALGRWDAASEAYRRALELDPVSPRENAVFLELLVDTHQYDRAIEQFRKTIELDPNNRLAYSWAGQAYELQGLGAESTAAYIKADSLAGRSAEQLQSLEKAAGSGGVRGYWRKRLEMLQEEAKTERVAPYDFASVYIHIGENDRAADMLEAAYQQHAPRLAWIRAHAFWQQLRRHPRYQSLLRRMHLPE